MDREARPNPDALIAAAARETRGHFKIILGAAPGVGKTWEMLHAAQRALDGGRDVVAGVIETHGRAETQEQIGTLPLLPRRAIEYRNQILSEFDLDAALARKPSLLLVDELAHTNAPGSRHSKRWEDVVELLAAGIDVWATLNVQHLESLNDRVAKITGVRVTETLPDRVIETADEIEFIDVTPAELRDRLQQGQIYRPDVAARALEGFFREGNISALREIALRQAAQRVDRDVTDYMEQRAIQGPWPAGDRVLALIGADAGAETVLRQAKRLADALHAPWIAMHIERPGENRDMRATLEMAAQLGAEIEVRPSAEIVTTLLDYAGKRNVTHLVMGRGKPARWRRWAGRTLAAALVRQGAEFALHVVPASSVPVRRVAPDLPRGWVPWVVSAALVGAVIGAGELFGGLLDHDALGMLFLAAVVGAATLYGLIVALAAAALSFFSWNLLFIEPRYTLSISAPCDVVALFVFAGVAAATGWLASRVRAEATTAQARTEGLRRITAFSRRLGVPANEPDLLTEIADQAADIGGRAVLLTASGEDLNIRAAQPQIDTLDDGSWAAARWCYARQEPAGRGTATLPGSEWRFLPLFTVRGRLGVLGVHPVAPLNQPGVQALNALADQAATAMERVRLAADAARGEAQAETQKLRTALLNSLSHDLRTPLTGIRGAAGTLRAAGDRMGAEQRADLLASIEQDTVRMTRFLTNIAEITRLESGTITPRRTRVALPDLLELAIGRVAELGPVSVDAPATLPDALADPDLLEQVLVNVLENAAKYSPHGAPVRVAIRRAGVDLLISVADEGVGIAPEDVPRVFDSFFRALREDRVVPGTGLGLAIARGLMEAMGGTIDAESPRPDAPRDGAPGAVIHLSIPASL